MIMTQCNYNDFQVWEHSMIAEETKEASKNLSR